MNKINNKCKHQYIELKRGFSTPGGTWSNYSISTFNVAIKVICTLCEEVKTLYEK